MPKKQAKEIQRETLDFQAEVTHLLDLMIHSLYSNKDIFLRELISNASDAIDRLRFAMIENKELVEDETEFAIHVGYDKDARTITVADNGIGMDRGEVMENIGTIAKSGTREFFKSLTGDQQKDAALIGQFGVGFYSSFVVADKVTLITRRAGLPADQAVRWESSGEGSYTLEAVDKASCGTEVILHLREGEDELLNGYRLREIIRKFSDHISVPIYMRSEEVDSTPDATDPANTVSAEPETPKLEQVNRASALWTRSKSEITPEEYTEFYKHLVADGSEPLTYLHNRMEGTQEYTLLLYVPSRAPFDLWSREQRHGVKLYVRRVFIMDDAEQLMPRYLRFIRGIIDSNDLPLNVSRELLQHNRLIEQIRSTAVKKVLGALADLASEQPDKYATFWTQFGAVLKEGVMEDHPNRESILSLLRFASTHAGAETQDVSLETYSGRMKEGQDKIFYVTGESFTAAANSPLLEVFRTKGVEVLLLTDPVDSWLVSEVFEFKGVALQSIAKGNLDLGKLEDQEEREAQQKATSDVQDVLARLKTVLSEQVKEVRTTTRLTTSAACLVADEYDLDPTLQRLLQSAGQQIPVTKRILEVNPEHPLIRKLSDEKDEQRFADWAFVLLDQSVLSLGESLDNPQRFVQRLNDLLVG